MVPSKQMPATWRCGRFSFEWQSIGDSSQPSHLPIVMGILNVTPDSFSDGGRFFSLNKAIDHAHQMIAQGAQIIDIGGESTKPGAAIVSASEEQDRVLPVIAALKHTGVALSIDSYKPSTMALAMAAGVDILNDVSGFSSSQNQAVATSSSTVGLCLMHMQNNPQTMQQRPKYEDVLQELNAFFSERVAALNLLGVSMDRICLDPGLGFGKTPEHNLTILNQLGAFSQHHLPMMIGISRKSTLGKIIDSHEPSVTASIAAMLASIQRGANVVRVHDVLQSVQAIKVWAAIESESIKTH